MLCIFIDALNPKYLGYMPFLNSLKKQCLYGSLEVPLGYTGIIASFVTGMHPEEHRIFDLFVPAEKRSCRIKNRYLLAAIRLLQNKRIFYTPMPVKEADYFKPSLDKTWAQKNCLNQKTIFDILEKNGRSFEVIDWPNHFKGRKAGILFQKSCKKALNLAKKSKADFVLVHFLDLETAHESGIDSVQVRNAARIIDNAVRELYEKDRDILIFSDHGMNDIKQEINIQKEISKLNLQFGRDLLYIIGSTTVEFWFRNRTAEQKIKKLLKRIKCGSIINQKDFRIKTGSDMIFLADLRKAFYPNFFSKFHFRAMHGWNPKEQKTAYFLKNHLEVKGMKNAKMVDFFPTILGLMGLPKEKCDGISLI
ncbi:MAG: alkaline phosphatase family protein [archaeon]